MSVSAEKLTPLANVHPTAIIHPKAKIAEDVFVGPYSCIGAEVTVKKGAKILSHAVLEGRTFIGENVKIYPFASIGNPPQDLKYEGENSWVEVGNSTTIREYVTIQPGTLTGKMCTVVGSHCLLMAGVHVAHDCHIGNHVILANYATLGGHVEIGEHSVIGGLAAIHQFVRIGAHVMVSGTAGVADDVIPFSIVDGKRARLGGLNIVGLKRHNFQREEILALREVYRHLFFSKHNTSSVAPPPSKPSSFTERLQTVDERLTSFPAIQKVLKFLKEQTERSICFPRNVFLKDSRQN